MLGYHKDSFLGIESVQRYWFHFLYTLTPHGDLRSGAESPVRHLQRLLSTQYRRLVRNILVLHRILRLPHNIQTCLVAQSRATFVSNPSSV